MHLNQVPLYYLYLASSVEDYNKGPQLPVQAQVAHVAQIRTPGVLAVSSKLRDLSSAWAARAVKLGNPHVRQFLEGQVAPNHSAWHDSSRLYHPDGRPRHVGKSILSHPSRPFSNPRLVLIRFWLPRLLRIRSLGVFVGSAGGPVVGLALCSACPRS